MVKTKNWDVLSFHSLRNISSPDDLKNDRKILSGTCPVKSVLNFETDQNVRDYLLEADGKKRRRPTQVHRAIIETLDNNADNFCVLNGGITLVAHQVDVDEKSKSLRLKNASIINGAQTQGVLRDYFDKYEERFTDDEYNPFVKFEIIVTTDDDLIAETSISRNFQNDVMPLSIVGRLGQLDELEEAFKEKLPNSKFQKSETKLSDDYVKTEKLLQVITALIPSELWPGSSDMNKVFTYNMKSKCLKLFQEVYEKGKNKDATDHKSYKALYQFYLDISSEAYILYNKWKKHSGFEGTRIRKIDRDSKGNIVNIPDGIIFPIIASFSEFVIKTEDGWKIETPGRFRDSDIIEAAKSVYMNIADSNPQSMGKSKACYSALAQVTQIFKRLGD
ncbi:AIPR family protein [Poritiphilus flavus]|uniref:Abortive phage infection protein C-terminal domain-containing protein n=1 Tax=Poritiphilus flavus TaxID=2697053 RepID=A0A6L9EED5_9FLAO|nr:AIPR family protein [Poritiphilus flavus]NAS13110.1 hypothetical protein [Poritiphilus flavus]